MTPKQIYKYFIPDSLYPFCWACGRSGSFGSKPDNWFGPFRLEKSHIVSSPRVEDVRAVVILCTRCHNLSHGYRFVVDGVAIPRLWPEHLIALKRQFDIGNYDRAWLGDHCVGKLPRAQALPQFYLAEFKRRLAA